LGDLAVYCKGHSIAVWSVWSVWSVWINGWDSAGNSSILHGNRHHLLVNVHRHSTCTIPKYTFQHNFYNTFVFKTDNAFFNINMDREHNVDTIEFKDIPTTSHQPANVQRLGRPAIGDYTDL
ncbi:hypothetical protein AC578_3173, partial [Pseudocercospora eumusae]